MLCVIEHDGNATATAITLATLAAITSVWSSGGFKEIDATHMPGWYRLDVPNAALAAAKGRLVNIQLSGVTNMRPVNIAIELTGWDNQATVESQALATAMTESYPTKGSACTARQALYAIMQFLYERGASGTTATIKKRDQSTTAKTTTQNSSTSPTSTTEAS